MAWADNDGVELFYSVDGPDEGDTVVFIEGLGYGRWMWRWHERTLAETFQTIRWDNRGTGLSDVPEGPYTISEMAADLEAVLAEHGTDTVHVVGASMGGMIAMQYALEYDRAATLTLMCTSPGGPDAVATPEDVLTHILDAPDGYGERELLEHRMQPAMSDEFAESSSLVDQILDWRMEQDASEESRLAQLAAVREFDVSNRLDELDLPTFVMHGTADRILPVENATLLHNRLPSSTLDRYEDGSHLFFIEDRNAVTDAVRSFIETHASAQ